MSNLTIEISVGARIINVGEELTKNEFIIDVSQFGVELEEGQEVALEIKTGK